MAKNAIILTEKFFQSEHAKTAHGLVRGTDRFRIVGVIDAQCAGQDAGEVLDGKHRNIPVYASIKQFFKQSKHTGSYAVVGVATKGGILPPSLKKLIVESIKSGLHVVNGLHDLLNDHDDLVALAKKHRVLLHDIRKPKKFSELHFWSGEISQVKALKVAVLGTDCALGKRTTTRFLAETAREAGIKAEWIYTGQTGWMQGAKYGFIFDSTLNDFISGEMEHAIVQCWKKEKPAMIFIEGQSALRNPSGPAGAEWLLSAAADVVVLQHHPKRKKYKGLEKYSANIPSLSDEIELIKRYGASVVAITLNTSDMKKSEAEEMARTLEKQLSIPVILPIEQGVQRVISVLKKRR